jgi:hypothetical protein
MLEVVATAKISNAKYRAAKRRWFAYIRWRETVVKMRSLRKLRDMLSEGVVRIVSLAPGRRASRQHIGEAKSASGVWAVRRVKWRKLEWVQQYRVHGHQIYSHSDDMKASVYR